MMHYSPYRRRGLGAVTCSGIFAKQPDGSWVTDIANCGPAPVDPAIVASQVGAAACVPYSEWSASPAFEMESCGSLPTDENRQCVARNQQRGAARDNIQTQYRGCVPPGLDFSFTPVTSAAETAALMANQPLEGRALVVTPQPAAPAASGPSRKPATGARTPAASSGTASGRTVTTTRAPSSAPGAPESGSTVYHWSFPSGAAPGAPESGSGTSGDGTKAEDGTKPSTSWFSQEMLNGIPNWALLAGLAAVGLAFYGGTPHGR